MSALSAGHARRTGVTAARAAVADASAWATGLDWLTIAAWLLTLICLGCAILDSYTSLCVVGGTLGHIGQAGACPGFGGWDTRLFPVAVDAGWGGALFAVLRLARTIGLQSWRWWTVLLFEVLTAAFTIAGNAFHGAVLDGATADFSVGLNVLISCVASAVPGVVAVGSGFTLSVLISTRRPPAPAVPAARASIPAPAPAASALPVAAPKRGAARPADASADDRRAAIAAYLTQQADAGRDPTAIGVSEIARATGIPRPTVYRLQQQMSGADTEPGGTGQQGVAA